MRDADIRNFLGIQIISAKYKRILTPNS